MFPAWTMWSSKRNKQHLSILQGPIDTDSIASFSMRTETNSNLLHTKKLDGLQCNICLGQVLDGTLPTCNICLKMDLCQSCQCHTTRVVDFRQVIQCHDFENNNLQVELWNDICQLPGCCDVGQGSDGELSDRLATQSLTKQNCHPVAQRWQWRCSKDSNIGSVNNLVRGKSKWISIWFRVGNWSQHKTNDISKLCDTFLIQKHPFDTFRMPSSGSNCDAVMTMRMLKKETKAEAQTFHCGCGLMKNGECAWQQHQHSSKQGHKKLAPLLQKRKPGCKCELNALMRPERAHWLIVSDIAMW